MLPSSLGSANIRGSTLNQQKNISTQNHCLIYVAVEDMDAHILLGLYAMLYRKYELPVRQYVIYIGKGKIRMRNRLETECLRYQFSLHAIADIDYRLLLDSNKPEELMLAILGDFKRDTPEKVTYTRIDKLSRYSPSELEYQKYLNQLRILAQLRKFDKINDIIMLSVASFWKPENDMFYIKGKEVGVQKAQTEVVHNLIIKSDWSNEQIADVAGVTAAFVKKVRAKSR